MRTLDKKSVQYLLVLVVVLQTVISCNTNSQTFASVTTNTTTNFTPSNNIIIQPLQGVMSFPAPAGAPESDLVVSTSPPILQAPSPEDDEITPPPAPPITLPISNPSLPPLVAPTLPIVVGETPPPTSLPPPLPPPTLPPTPQPPQPQPQPQPHPQPELQPQPQPPLSSPPPNNFFPPLTKPIDTKPPQTPPTSTTTSDPVLPTSPPSPPDSPRSPKTRPIIKPTPTRPKSIPPTPSSSSPPSPLPTSAVLPSSPPVALPVPQTPSGGAWIPFSTESPTPLPILPGPPRTLGSPTNPLHGSTIPSSSSSSSSSSSDEPNIASAVAPKGSSYGTNGFVVGLAVGGILLLLLGTVFGILVVFCKRRDKKKVGDNETGSKPTTLYNEFEEKNSLPHNKKQASNTTLGQHTKINNVSPPKGPTMATKGTHQVNAGSTLGNAPSFSSGSFTYEELSRATDGFSEHNLLGQGGFGYVHKGVLANGKEVAVKQLKMGGQQGEREFRAEVETISQVHHKHLVSLVGYCIAGAERLLVYEFVPNNTLEFHLHGNGQPVMDWPTRLKIAIGSAKGFAYLHEDCSPTIIHRDIKAANILLDYNFEAKVSDFRMARIFSSTNPSATHITTRVVGTFGYLAPEYASSGKVTDKSDVYSYGVMLLELITGRPPISNFESSINGSLVNWARPLMAQAIGDGKFDTLVDPRLQNNYDVDEMASMVACAAACVRLSAWRRPRMSQVVRALEGNLPPSELDDGTRPGQSSMHFPYENSDFDARNYLEDLKRMAFAGNNGHTTSVYSENTSEYGLNPSASSSDTSHISNSRG